jgi:hypothetical protein
VARSDLHACSPGAARARIWQRRPDLVQAHETAAAEPKRHREANAVRKARRPFDRIDEAAREELPVTYATSPSAARAQIAMRRPELADSYYNSFAYNLEFIG